MAADNKNGGNSKINYATKADVILQRQAEITAKLDTLLSHGAGTAGTDALVDKISRENAYVSRQNSEIFEKLTQENEQLRKEMNFLSAQCENIFARLSDMIRSLKESCAIDYEKLAGIVGAPAKAAARYTGDSAGTEYTFADEVAPAAAETDLSDGEQLTISEQYINYNELAERIADKLAAKAPQPAPFDTDELAKKVAACIPPQELISPEYIASKVAEQIVVPQVVMGESGQMRPIQVHATANVDYEEVASRVAEKISATGNAGVSPAAAESVLGVMDTDSLSDEIAKKVAALAPNDFDILVDDEGCRSLAEAMAEVLDYDRIIERLVDRKNEVEAESYLEGEGLNTEELASFISDKLKSAGLNEDAIADKTAAALSNVMPEIDADDITDKIVSAVLESVRVSFERDYDAIASSVYDKLADLQANNDYDIVIDEEGIERLTGTITERIISAVSGGADKSDTNEKAAPSESVEEVQDAASVEESESEPAIAAEDAAVQQAYVSAPAEQEDGDIRADLEDLKKKMDSLNDKLDNLFDFGEDGEDVDGEYEDEEGDEPEYAEEYGVDLDGIKSRLDAVVSRLDDLFGADDKEHEGEEEDEPEYADEYKAEFDEVKAKLDGISARLNDLFGTDDGEHDGEEGDAPEYAEEYGVDLDGIKSRLDAVVSRLDDLFGADDKEHDGEEEDEPEYADEYKAEFDEVKAKLDGISARLNDLFGTDDGEHDGEEGDVPEYAEEYGVDLDGIKSRLDAVVSRLDDLFGADDKVHEGEEGDEPEYVDEYGAELDEIKAKLDGISARLNDLFGADDGEGEHGEEDDDGYVYDDEVDDEFKKLNDKLDRISDKIDGGLSNGYTPAADRRPNEEYYEQENASAGEESLVKVSDIIDENDTKSDEAPDEVMETIMADVAEELAEGEAQPDGLPGISNGVDFAGMMKYNRSFIARIIQSSDDVKRYYGQVKNAMLAYKKVNSNISWGAERFSKGRETIAKLKIRGKTLCLYLNLDPKEYATTVYHHVDVSGNKSMHGTPMMVKIKSPLGARKAIRLIDQMLAKRDGVKRAIQERDYAAMYPYESIEELIEDGLVKDVSKK